MTDEADHRPFGVGEDGEPRARPAELTFAEWCKTRPVAGALALVASGVVIAWPSLAFVRGARLLQGEAVASFGVILGALLVLSGVAALVRPGKASAIGVAALVLSAASFLVAFGGLLVGMLLGSLGGVACFAWTPPAETDDDLTGSP